MIETRRDGHKVYFHFVCPGCGAEGELGIDTSGVRGKPFVCPEDCGSVFVPWQPYGQEWLLKCVVQRCAVDDDGDPHGEADSQ